MALDVNLSTKPIDLRRLVLQKFGIVLGLVYAHHSPVARISWNKDALYTYARGQGKDQAWVNNNYLMVFRPETAYYTDGDPLTIMMLSFPPSLTLNRLKFPISNELSEKDKEFVAKLYPQVAELHASVLEENASTSGSESGSQPYGVTHVADPAKLWVSGTTLRVAFLEGDPKVQKKVFAVAKEWSKYANIKFERITDIDAAEIRISFKQPGAWSYIGTDCLEVARDRPTMNFGWLTPITPDKEYGRVVLHMFGHALGLLHPHHSPTSNIPWDREAVIREYSGLPNRWSLKQIDINVLDKYSRTNTVFDAEFDSASIMCYPIPPRHTAGRFEVKSMVHELSEGDKRFIALLYPAKGQFEFHREREVGPATSNGPTG
jgi:hypothetical protein